jgi:hypothetical protein
MMDIYVDGVRQIPGINYTLSKDSVAFSMPPNMGSHVEIVSAGRRLARILGDGSTFLFQFMAEFQDHGNIVDMMNDALKLRTNPAVAEALERLQVIVELAKQDDTLR